MRLLQGLRNDNVLQEAMQDAAVVLSVCCHDMSSTWSCADYKTVGTSDRMVMLTTGQIPELHFGITFNKSPAELHSSNGHVWRIGVDRCDG